MAVPGAPGGYDLFVPTLELSGNLQVRFSRNTSRFNVNRYAKIVPVKKKYGEYLYFHPGDQARLQPDSSRVWASGNPRPRGTAGQLGFLVNSFRCERYSDSTTLDAEAVDLANWDVQKAHTESLSQKAMTFRAKHLTTKMFTSSNYPAANVFATATAIGAGGSVYGGSATDPRILKMYNRAAEAIMAATMGRIQYFELFALMNHVTAKKMAETTEIRDYVKQQPDAYKNLLYDRDKNYNAAFGLPQQLYGIETIVETQFYASANRPGTQTQVDADTGTKIIADDTILFGVRTENLEAQEGLGDYSTWTFFVFEDMSVESRSQDWNRLLELSVVDTWDDECTAPVTGCLVQNIAG